MSALYDFTADRADHQSVSLGDYRGRVLLIVNTASKCGFTPQYEGLEALQQNYHAQGFDVLAFPCNQFGKQEPGTESEIVEFCSLNYGASFPIFAKIEVNGAGSHPLYQWLRKQASGILGTGSIKWNFTKFLVDREGNVVKRYGSAAKPEKIAADIEKLL